MTKTRGALGATRLESSYSGGLVSHVVVSQMSEEVQPAAKADKPAGARPVFANVLTMHSKEGFQAEQAAAIDVQVALARCGARRSGRRFEIVGTSRRR